jgi:hypothetical protein
VVLPQLGHAKMTPLSSGANTQLVVVSEGGDGPCSLAPLVDINVKKATIYKIIPPTAAQDSRLDSLRLRIVACLRIGGEIFVFVVQVFIPTSILSRV